MKKLLFTLFMGLMVTGSTWCMQSITITTNDGGEYTINRNAVRFSKTLNFLVEDIDVEEAIPLTEVSSKEWEAIVKIFVNSETQLIKPAYEIDLALRDLNLATLLSLLSALDYLSPQITYEDGKPVLNMAGEPVDVTNMISNIIAEKIKASSNKKADMDNVIKLLEAHMYTIPAQFEPSIVQALLIASKLVDELFFLKVVESGVVSSVAWHPDGRLAIGSDQQGVYIWEPNGTITTVDGMEGVYVFSVAWHPDGSLAMGGPGHAVYILEPDGTLTTVNDTEELGIRSVAWHPDGRLVMGGPQGAYIWEADGTITTVAGTEGKSIYSVAWHSDGRLAIGSNNGAFIWKKNGSLTIVDDTEGINIYSVAWHPDGRLALGGEGIIWIRKKDGTIINVGKNLGKFKSSSVAWNVHDGRLAVVTQYGQDSRIRVRELDGNLGLVNVEGVHRFNAVAWSYDGALAIGSTGTLGHNVGIYGQIPQKYQNLTIDEALMIIKKESCPLGSVGK